jgi:hypothetical protein
MIATWMSGNAETDPVPTCAGRKQWVPAEELDEDLPAKRFWVGIDRDRPTVPSDLAWKRQHDGNWMILADGNPWLIPAAIRLPHKYKLGPGGKAERVIADQYAEFYRLAEQHMTTIFRELDLLDVLSGENPDKELSAEPVAIAIEDGVRFCWTAMQLIYRVNPDILSALEVLDDQSLQRVIAGAIDLPTIIETRDSKKKYSPVEIPLG